MSSTTRRPILSSRSRRASMRLSLITVQTQNPPENIKSKKNSAADAAIVANRRRCVFVDVGPTSAAEESVCGPLTTPVAAEARSPQSASSAFDVRRAVSVSAVTAPITTVCPLSCTKHCRCTRRTLRRTLLHVN